MFPTHFFGHNTIIFFTDYAINKSESSFIFYDTFFCKIEYFGLLIMYNILLYYYISFNDQFGIMVI